MNIWIIRHYTLINSRPHIWAKELVKRGHNVTLFASSFNHQTFKEEHLQKGESCREEILDGVKFIWLRGIPYKTNDWRRYLGTIEFTLRAIWIGLKQNDKPDTIIGTVVHPFAPAAAYVLSRFKKSRFNYELNDVWPQVLVEEGVASEKALMIRFLRFLERFLMKRANRIQSILPHVGDYLDDIGILHEKFIWVPNPITPELFADIEPYTGTKDGKFKIIFITTFPPNPINFDVILDAAELLQKENTSNFELVFVGDGRSRAEVEERSRKMRLDNVRFTGWIPKDQLYKVMKDASAFLVTAKPYRIHRYGVAYNKLYTSFMGKRPIIFTSFDPRNPVATAKAGITIQDGKPVEIVDAVKNLMSMSVEEISLMGMNGYKYAMNNHHIQVSVDRLLAAVGKFEKE